MEALRIVQKMVWGPWLLGLFLAVGVLCMVRLRGFPIRHIRVWWGETVGSGGKGQLLTTCTALAATVGTGNITGVAAALAIGGPGAVFWMWAAAFLGMALAYTEVYLGIFVWGRTLCLSGKWGWKLFRWKMLCPVLRAGVAWNGMYGTGGGLWRIVCAMQRPCRRLEPVSYWQF